PFPFSLLEVCDSITELLLMERSFSHHLPTQLVIGPSLPFLPCLPINGHRDPYPIEGHFFHLAPRVSHILGITDSSALVDELLRSRSLGRCHGFLSRSSRSN